MVIRMIQLLLQARHAANFDQEMTVLSLAMLRVLGEGALVWLFYLALEPYVRRFWPQTLVSWARVLAGRLRDPLVGRDLLIGATLGAFWALVNRLDSLIVPALGLGTRPRIRTQEMLTALLGGRHVGAVTMETLCIAIYKGLFFVLLIALLRAGLRRSWLTVVVAVLLLYPMYIPRGAHPAVSWLTIGVAGIVVGVLVIMRFGLLTVTTGLFVLWLLTRLPLTLHMQAWYADISLFAVLLTAAIALYGLLGVWSTRALERT